MSAGDLNERVILGIDPGYARLGWGVVRVCGAPNCSITCLDYGTFETSPDEEMGQRLCAINEELLKIINKYSPHDIAIEELFFAKNAKTAMKVSAARGVIMMRAVYHSGRIFEYKPNQVKVAVTGERSADKKEMQSVVAQILRLCEIPKPDDAADALAVAITHAVTCKQ